MPTVTRRTGTIIAGLMALVLTAGLVVRTSQAVFSSTTTNTGNSLAAGTVVLTDDDGGGAGSALLQLTNVAPGESTSNCIKVSYTGSLDPTAVTVYSGGNAPIVGDPDFDTQVLVTIEEGTGTVATRFDDCTGFTPTSTLVNAMTLRSFESMLDYTSGVAGWNPAGPGESRIYRVTLGLDQAASNTFQGARVSGIGIVWETKSS